ncbi:MAG: hypothetical protein R2757_07015 [Draconibacterium sp.]
MTNTAFIVQARVGSTRLSNKVLLPFFEGQSILELLISKLKDNFSIPVIVATTTNNQDDKLVNLIRKQNINIFRGSENNVLKRFIEAAKEYNIKNIIRVCADNPFLSVKYVERLIFAWDGTCDYHSFKTVEGTPSIQTHYGFWTELVTLETLVKIQNLNVDRIYLEHVTNYIYTHPDEFKIQFEAIPEWISENKNIRLTLDTLDDFEVQKEIYHKLVGQEKKFDVEEIIEFLKNNPHYLKHMEQNIKQNQKK